jgi:NADH-quinone oxidoreductase subunit C
METTEQIRNRLLARFPSSKIEVAQNPGPAAQHGLLVDAAHARAIARFLRDDPELLLDYCSNVTGLDWPEREIVETVKKSVPDPAGGPAKIVEEKTKRREPGRLEVVYHLYSMARRHGPVILRLRTADRAANVALPSLTPVWRSCDLQEREVFDLFGVIFEGHPNLRRILMWDGFTGHPMRKDYVSPDDHEWEPTPHGVVLERAKAARAAAAPAEPRP